MRDNIYKALDAKCLYCGKVDYNEELYEKSIGVSFMSPDGLRLCDFCYIAIAEYATGNRRKGVACVGVNVRDYNVI